MNRNNYLFLAKIAEQTGRFEDMSEMMKGVVIVGESLSKEEKALLSTAYRHLVGERRVAWRMVTSGYANINDNVESSQLHNMLDIMRSRIEDEIMEYCEEMQELLLKTLQSEICSEGRVSILKMKGDYYRYVAEIKVHEELEDILELAHDSYMKAYMLALKTLSPLNDTRLGLALNFAVFFYEVAKDIEKALLMAKETYRAGLDQVDRGELASKEAVVVLKLLRDNISLWNNLLEIDALRLERQQEQAHLHSHQQELASLRHDRYEFQHVIPQADRFDRQADRFDRPDHRVTEYPAEGYPYPSEGYEENSPQHMRPLELFPPSPSSNHAPHAYQPCPSPSSQQSNISPHAMFTSAGGLLSTSTLISPMSDQGGELTTSPGEGLLTSVDTGRSRGGGGVFASLSSQAASTTSPAAATASLQATQTPSPSRGKGSPFTSANTSTSTKNGSCSVTGVGVTTSSTLGSPLNGDCLEESSPDGVLQSSTDKHRVSMFHSPVQNQVLRDGQQQQPQQRSHRQDLRQPQHQKPSQHSLQSLAFYPEQIE